MSKSVTRATRCKASGPARVRRSGERLQALIENPRELHGHEIVTLGRRGLLDLAKDSPIALQHVAGARKGGLGPRVGATVSPSSAESAQPTLSLMDAYTTHTKQRGAGRRSKISVPKRVGPHVRLLFEEMRRQGVTYEEMAALSGVNVPAIKAWRHRNAPSLTSVEAALGALGWDFVPIPRATVLPPEMIEELSEAAVRLNLTVPATLQALVEIVAGIHARFGEQPSANKPVGAIDAREAPQAPAKRPRGRHRRSAAPADHDKVSA